MKKITASIVVLGGLLLSAVPAFAHSVVSPKQVGVAAFQDFSLGVPSEKAASTTSVRLMLPAGLNFVSPVVKPGWQVQVKSGPIPAGMTAPKAADGDMATSIPTEIDWTGGNIPADQKDIFVFSAQVPAQPTTLNWKVYQGYSDGSTVSWDLGPNEPQPQDSKGNPDFSSKGPYSITQVVNDLKPSSAPSMVAGDTGTGSNKTLLIALVALALAAVSLAMQLRKR
jgi:uncharacterized protein YcnI